MKKRNLKSLMLNKKSISVFQIQTIKGGEQTEKCDRRSFHILCPGTSTVK